MKNCPTCQKTYPDDFGHCPRDGTALVEAGGWIEGAVVRGKYRILAKLGQGGMGAVYKAVHLRFGEVRALKVMSPQVAGDPLFVKRFEQEAVLTRKLQHPNAVRVDDIDESEDGRPFIVMEYIEGQSLKHVIESEGPLPVARVCTIIKQVAAALGAAHELGMVHRDIKPDNIVLVAQGSPSSPAALPALKPGKDLERPQGQSADPALPEIAKVLDFGIAKLKEVRATETAGLTLTGTGVVIGTPQYMSPEQAAGKRGDELDGRSDLYSLGVVMYEMLCGSLPFKSDTPMGMLHAHMQEQPRPILSVRPDLQIPESLAAVVMKCLEKKPEHRSASAAALIAELERAEKQWAEPLAPTRIMRPAVVGERSALPSSSLRSATPGSESGAVGDPSALRPSLQGTPAPRPENGRPEASPTNPPPGAPWPPAREAPRLPQRPPAAAQATNWKVGAAVATVLVGVALGAWYFSGTRGGSPNPVNEYKGSAVSVAAKAGTVSENPKDGLKYVWIPPGTFQMGCSPGDNECSSEEKPSHRVTLTKGFSIGQTPVTVGAYKRFARSAGKAMPPEPNFSGRPLNGGWNNEAMPIVNVTWDEAREYCTWAGGRLPTEAEWEYAARGGSMEARYGSLDDVAWYADNSGQQRLDSDRIWKEVLINYAQRLKDNGNAMHEVGRKRANGFGLYDMLGNVWQWLNDWYDQNYYRNGPSQDPSGPTSGQLRVLRGGSWYDNPRDVRVSVRGSYLPGGTDGSINGFRCVREADSP